MGRFQFHVVVISKENATDKILQNSSIYHILISSMYKSEQDFVSFTNGLYISGLPAYSLLHYNGTTFLIKFVVFKNYESLQA